MSILHFYNIFLQALLQARLGAYIDSNESGEVSEGEVDANKEKVKEKVEAPKPKPEVISLVDDSDSCNETHVKSSRRSRWVFKCKLK